MIILFAKGLKFFTFKNSSKSFSSKRHLILEHLCRRVMTHLCFRPMGVGDLVLCVYNQQAVLSIIVLLFFFIMWCSTCTDFWLSLLYICIIFHYFVLANFHYYKYRTTLFIKFKINKKKLHFDTTVKLFYNSLVCTEYFWILQ